MAASQKANGGTAVQGLPHLLSSLLLVSAILGLFQRVDTIYAEPPIWVPAVSVTVLVLLRRRLPIALTLFWLAGIASLAWSLGPGNTLVAFLWESLSIAAFAAGVVPWPGLAALALTLLDGFLDILAMSTFGTQVYLSGSVGYVAGGVGLSAFVLGASFASQANLGRVWRAVAALGGAIALTTALASGSRAVYLAVVLSVLALVVRVALTGTRRELAVLVQSLLLIFAATAVVELAGKRSIITPAWRAKGGLERSAESITDYGVLTQRLRLWDQAVKTVQEYPFGTGLGTYATTAHAFQSYPMLWSSSPHNYVMRVLATGGWLRVALLLLFLSKCCSVGLRARAFPWTVAGLALGVTTLLDVTGDYPRVTTLVYFLLGAGYFANSGSGAEQSPLLGRNTIESILKKVGIGLAMVASAWWYLPCSGNQCTLHRYLGFDTRAVASLRAASPAERDKLFEGLRHYYPRSLWVLLAELAFETEPERRLALLREVALDYPYQHPENFLRWAELAISMGDNDQAIRALQLGLQYFPSDRYPYGEMRMTPERYKQWVDTARALLADLHRAPDGR